MPIKYQGKYQQVKYLAGGKGSEFRPGAMSEIVVVEDLSRSERTQYVLKRPVVSDRSGQKVPLSEQNTALVREYNVLKIISEHLSKFNINFPQIVEFGKDAGNFAYEHYYLITTFISGAPLTSEPVPPVIASLNAFKHVLIDLRKIHGLGIVVNDTRHEHIYWDEEIDPIGEKPNSISMLDFGNARFLPGSPETLSKLNVEGSYQATEKDDYRQLGESLFRLLTGSNTFSNQNWMKVLNLRYEYQQLKLLCEANDVIQLIGHLLNADGLSAQAKIEEIIEIVNNKRNTIYADIEERKKEFSDFNDFIGVLNKHAQIIGFPAEIYKDKWKKYYTELEHQKELDDAINQLKENIKSSSWQKILSSNIGVIGKYDEKKANLLEALVFIITQQNQAVDIQLEIVLALNSIADGDYENARNQAGALINYHFARNEKDDYWERLYIPFFNAICKSIDQPKSIINYLDAIGELKSANSFQMAKQIYNKYHSHTKDELFVLGAKHLEWLEKEWNQLLIPEIKSRLSNLIETEEFNPFYNTLQGDIIVLEQWLNSSSFRLDEIPRTNIDHSVFAGFSGTEGMKLKQKIDFLFAVETYLMPAIHNEYMKQSLSNWLGIQKESLRDSAIVQAIRIFENEIDIRDAFKTPDNSLLRYLKEKDAEWYKILFYTFTIDQNKGDVVRLKKLAEELRLETKGEEHKQKWEFLQLVINFRVKQLSSGAADGTLTDQISGLAPQITSNESSHWLFKNTKQYYGQESKPLVVANKVPWWRMPQMIFFGGAITTIVLVLTILFASSLLRQGTTPVAPTQTDQPVASTSKCDLISSFLENGQYDDLLNLLAICEANIDKSRISDEIFFSIREDLYHKRFDTDASLVIDKITGWKPENDTYFEYMKICGTFLNLTTGDKHNAEAYWSNNMVSPPPPGWEFYCGWNPGQLMLDATGGIEDYRDAIDPLLVGDNFLLDHVKQEIYKTFPNQYLDFQFQFIPELSDGQTNLPVQIGFNDKLESIDLSSIPNFVMNSRRLLIIIDWNYRNDMLAMSYKIYAPEDVVTIRIEPGETFLNLERKYGINAADLKRFNHIEELFAGDEIFLVDSNAPLINNVLGTDWIQIGAKEFSYEVDDVNTYFPLIKLSDNLPVQYNSLLLAVDSNKR